MKDSIMLEEDCDSGKAFTIYFSVFILLAFCALARAEDAASSHSTATIVEAQSPEPAAKVTGKTWPVQLTLHLLNTKIKPRTHLWYRISVTNYGDHDIEFLDRFLGFPTELQNNIDMQKFVYLVVLGPDGKKAPWSFLGIDNAVVVPDFRGPELRVLAENTQKELLEKGIPEDEINRRIVHLLEFPPPILIPPGKTFDSIPWAYDPFPERGAPPKHSKKPIGLYTELPYFDLSQPGEYKIKAVYDQTFPKEAKELQTHPDRPEIGAVRVETPWIHFQVER